MVHFNRVKFSFLYQFPVRKIKWQPNNNGSTVTLDTTHWTSCVVCVCCTLCGKRGKSKDSHSEANSGKGQPRPPPPSTTWWEVENGPKANYCKSPPRLGGRVISSRFAQHIEAFKPIKISGSLKRDGKPEVIKIKAFQLQVASGRGFTPDLNVSTSTMEMTDVD